MSKFHFPRGFSSCSQETESWFVQLLYEPAVISALTWMRKAGDLSSPYLPALPVSPLYEEGIVLTLTAPPSPFSAQPSLSHQGLCRPHCPDGLVFVRLLGSEIYVCDPTLFTKKWSRREQWDYIQTSGNGNYTGISYGNGGNQYHLCGSEQKTLAIKWAEGQRTYSSL